LPRFFGDLGENKRAQAKTGWARKRGSVVLDRLKKKKRTEEPAAEKKKGGREASIRLSHQGEEGGSWTKRKEGKKRQTFTRKKRSKVLSFR